MKKIAKVFALGLALALPTSSVNAKTYPTFEATEIETHLQVSQKIAQEAALCLDETYKTHIEFFDKHGVSKYYGDRRPQHSTRAGLIRELRRFRKSPSLVSQLEPTSCIGLTINCLGRGFEKYGLSTTWQKIFRFLKQHGVQGTDLQIMLRELGWKVYYWNPSPASNQRWDAEDKRINPLPAGRVWNPVWGGHEYRYKQVLNKGQYYTVSVDDSQSLVGFGSNPPEWFSQVAFFVGTAHAGYHVFPGRRGEVIEAHSTRPLNSRDNLEFSEFNPLAPGGGPKWTAKERYRSGLIAIPPNSNF